MKNILFILFSCNIIPALASSSEEPLTMIFAHGIANTHKQAFDWQKAHPHLHKGPILAIDFPDATEQFWRTNFWLTSLGQDNEIAALKKAVDAYQEEQPNKKIILAGISRGAATTINYTALCQPNDIAALIVISPFSSMQHIAQHIVKNSVLNNIPYAQELSPYLVGCVFWQYANNGVHPIDVVTKIDRTIPVLFISLETDHLIPKHLTQLLVDKLVASGHKRTHHIVLKEGRHGKPIPGKEGKRMEYCIQAFLCLNKLPCNIRYAIKGMKHIILKDNVKTVQSRGHNDI